MIKYIDELSLAGRRVLMRVDFNVPLDEARNITDDNRIRAALPSVQHALEAGAALILCSHLGRPKGERKEEFSLRPVARRLGELCGCEVTLAPDCVGAETEKMATGLADGTILLLENLRFHNGETKNDPRFGEALARLAGVYINDAFAVSHRSHASVVGVPAHVDECAGGFLLQRELEYFNMAMEQPERPLVAILGGAKVSGKLGAVRNIMKRVDRLVIGGAMANTFLLAKGLEIGTSLVEEDLVATARSLMNEAEQRGVALHLPVDCVVAAEITPQAEAGTVSVQEVPPSMKILDIGPRTLEQYKEIISDARTIVWNGPMGAFEHPPFSRGTVDLAHAVAGSRALSIIGGGDTGAAVKLAGESKNVSYVSTGGGAFLALLEGKELPGIAALKECSKP